LVFDLKIKKKIFLIFKKKIEARGGGQTATAALLSLQRQFENCIIQTIRDGMATQPKCDPPPPTNSNNCSSHNCDAANNNCC